MPQSTYEKKGREDDDVGRDDSEMIVQQKRAGGAAGSLANCVVASPLARITVTTCSLLTINY